MEAIELTPTVLQSLSICKVYKDPSEISSLSFSRDGHYLLSSSSTINFYSILKSSHEKSILCQSSQVSFTNHPHGFLSITPNAIDYWNLPATRIIHSFPINNAVQVDMSPRHDIFLATTLKSLSVFDLNTKKCVSILEVSESVGKILCKFDKYGLIFVIVYPVINEGKYKNYIQAFDAKDFCRGAFAIWNFESAEAVSIDFSFDGQYFVINTKTNQIYVMDAIEGKIKNVFKDYLGNGVCPVVFSPDSKYFFSACEKNSSIVAVGVENCQKVHDIRGCDKGVKALSWSPEHCLMATGNDYLVLWVPDYMRLR